MTHAFPVDSDVVGYDENGRPIGDRAYNAGDLQEIGKTFFTNGVLVDDGGLNVAPSDGMSVVVAGGKCHIEGKWKVFDEPRTLVLQSSDPTYDRIDTVVLRWNGARSVRDIDLYVKTGTPQLSPVAPSLTRNNQVYELGLSNIFVAKNTSAISASRITDTRLDDSRCGAVSPLIDVDTTTFYNQLQEATQEAVDAMNDALEAMDEAMSGTVAGNLQSQIDAINANNWVTTNRINNGAITSAKLAEKSVTESALSDTIALKLNAYSVGARAKKVRAALYEDNCQIDLLDADDNGFIISWSEADKRMTLFKRNNGANTRIGWVNLIS